MLLLAVAFRNLFRARLRTLLTLLGVAASLSVYVMIASMSYGYKEQLDRTLATSGVEVIVQARRAATPLGSRVSTAQAAKIAALPGVRTATPLLVGAIRTKTFPYTILIGFEGVTPGDAVGRWLEGSLVAGRLAAPGGGEVALGHLAAKRSKLWVGDKVKFDDKREVEVVGVLTTGLDMVDGAVLTDKALAVSILGQTSDYNMVLVKVAEGADAVAVMRSINDGEESLAAFPSEKLADRLRNLMLIDNFIFAVGAASFLLASLLVLNTLVLSVSERTRELGILSAIGWSRTRITSMITLEALVLCLAGGLCAYPIAWAALPLISFLPSVGVGWVPLAPQPGVMPATLALSSAVGVVSALFPALYSTSVKPAEALRRD